MLPVLPLLPLMSLLCKPINLSKVMNWIATMDPQFDFRPVLEQWQLEAANELDFTRESTANRQPSGLPYTPKTRVYIYMYIKSNSV